MTQFVQSENSMAEHILNFLKFSNKFISEIQELLGTYLLL